MIFFTKAKEIEAFTEKHIKKMYESVGKIEKDMFNTDKNIIHMNKRIEALEAQLLDIQLRDNYVDNKNDLQGPTKTT